MRIIARRDEAAVAKSRSRSPHSKPQDDQALLATAERQGIVSQEPERSIVSYDDAKAAVEKAIEEFDEFRAFWAERHESQTSAEWAKKNIKKSPKNN